METTKFHPSGTATQTEKNCQNPLFQGHGESAESLRQPKEHFDTEKWS